MSTVKTDPSIRGFAQEWWSDDMHEARTTFFKEFVELNRVEYLNSGKRLKEFGHSPMETQVLKLCNFFDKVGYLMAINALDPKQVLLAIWHSMQKTWMAIEQFVIMERRPKEDDEYFDPTYMIGFEMLNNFAKDLNEQPLDLLATHYNKHAKTIDPQQVENMTIHLDTLMADFRKKIEAQDKEVSWLNAE